MNVVVVWNSKISIKHVQLPGHTELKKLQIEQKFCTEREFKTALFT